MTPPRNRFGGILDAIWGYIRRDLTVVGEASVGGRVASAGLDVVDSYSGTSSHQAAAADLEVGAAVGVSTGSKFIAAAMWNLLGDALTKTKNYLGAVIAMYSVTGTKATTYPSGAVLAGIADGVTDVDGAVVAFIDGDDSQTIANAAFTVRHNNSTAGSGFNYLFDGYAPARDGYNAGVPLVSDLRLSNGLGLYALATAIVANTTTTTAPAGSLAITSHGTGVGKLYVSDGAKWQYVGVS